MDICNMAKNKIVPDGQQRIKVTEDYKQKVGGIRQVIRDKYQSELGQANLFQRWMLDLKIRREIRREVKKLAPDDALYFTS